MKRRQFLKSATAAASLPLLPAGLASASPVTAAQYAKAVEAANLWAYMTVGNLKRTLGVDEATSQAVLNQLQIDGILGPMGKSGISLTQKFVKERAVAAVKTATRLNRPQTNDSSKLLQKTKEFMLGPEEDASECATEHEESRQSAHNRQEDPGT